MCVAHTHTQGLCVCGKLKFELFLCDSKRLAFWIGKTGESSSWTPYYISHVIRNWVHPPQDVNLWILTCKIFKSSWTKPGSMHVDGSSIFLKTSPCLQTLAKFCRGHFHKKLTVLVLLLHWAQLCAGILFKCAVIPFTNSLLQLWVLVLLLHWAQLCAGSSNFPPSHSYFMWTMLA